MNIHAGAGRALLGVKVVFFCWAGDGIRASEPQRFMKLLKKNSRHGAWYTYSPVCFISMHANQD